MTTIPAATDFPGVPEAYRGEFQKIRDSNETYKGRWNWAAFFLGPLWGFPRGVWLASLIYIVAALVTSGFGGIAYAVVFGARGTYMYYCAHAKKKQLAI
jgi:hypothetical protein